MHLAEVLELVMKEGHVRLPEKSKEGEEERDTTRRRRWKWVAAGAVAVAGVAAGAAALKTRGERRFDPAINRQ
jgi:hypothetical protein